MAVGSPRVGVNALLDWNARERAKSITEGRINPETGLPTRAALIDAAQAYGNAMMMGSSGIRGGLGVRAFHGTTAKFDKFDPQYSGTGATEGFFAHPKDLPQLIYSASERPHAEMYGTPLEINISGKIKNYNAVPELNAWAKELGFKNTQRMVDEYFDGNLMRALSADQYLIDKMKLAKDAGIPSVSVDFGNLLHRVSDNKQIKFGKIYVTSDPSRLTMISDAAATNRGAIAQPGGDPNGEYAAFDDALVNLMRKYTTP